MRANMDCLAIMFILQGFEVVLASTKGGKIPLDAVSLQETNLTGAAKNFHSNSALCNFCVPAISSLCILRPKHCALMPIHHGLQAA